MDSTPRCAASPAAAGRRRAGYTQLSDVLLDALDKPCRDFFWRLKRLHRFQPYFDETIEEIAHQLGVCVATVKRHLKTILNTHVPGFSHFFGTRVKVRGRWRYYLVDQHGEATVPADLGFKDEPRRAQKRSSRAESRTIGGPRTSSSFRGAI